MTNSSLQAPVGAAISDKMNTLRAIVHRNTLAAAYKNYMGRHDQAMHTTLFNLANPSSGERRVGGAGDARAKDAGGEVAGLKRGDPGSLLRGSPGYQIVPELTPLAGDVIVDKTANGAFYQTDLELVLRARGITHLIFSGCTTDVCVHTTLREAVDRKYQCLLVQDACASADAYAHSAALHMVTVEDGVFGVLASLDDVLTGLSTLKPVAC